MSAPVDTPGTGENLHSDPLPKSEGNTSGNIDISSPYTPRRPAPIVSISINHPIATAIRKIKNFLTHKQTLFSTTFTIKITPIVAIVSLFGALALFGGGVTTAFTIGKTVEQKFLAATMIPTSTPRISPAPVIVTVSKAGTIKETYQLPVVNPSGIPITPSPFVILNASEGSQFINRDSSQAQNDIPTPHVLHYILVSRSGSITYLSSNSVQLQNYLNLRVLITGSYDSAKNSLLITNSQDIEVLN